MTSSLVGSEMCIRDSLSKKQNKEDKQQAQAQAKADPGNFTGMSLAAVSYTHLTLPTICSV
eukprot:6953294-Prorocentrum_lima.AAC.1